MTVIKLTANQAVKILDANEERQLIAVINHTFNTVVTIDCGVKCPIVGHGSTVQIRSNPIWTGEVSAIASEDVEIEAIEF